jgi:hypothetical protein
MREVAEEYDLVMNEDLPAIVEDRLKHDKHWLEQNKSEPDIWEKRYYEVRRKLIDLENEKRVSGGIVDALWDGDMEAIQYTDEELNAMCDAAEKKEPKTYDEMIAAGWEMTADGFWFREPKDDFKAWNGLIPGTIEAKNAGCLCPVMDNEEMPDDKKWVDSECPIHGRKKHD